MKDASAAMVREIGDAGKLDATDPEQAARYRLSFVAGAFVELQAARGRADYDVDAPIEPLDAAVDIAFARAAFQSWAEVKNEPLAQGYLYSLLFRDRP